jgi:acetate kinase
MGTRSGDLDPGLFGFLSRQLGLAIAQIEDALYSDSGLQGLTGLSDMRTIEDRAAAGDAEAQLAIEIFAYRARKYIGAYAAAMGGLDTVVFTGGIGENSAEIRRRVCEGLGWAGLVLDPARNAAGPGRVSTDASTLHAWVIPTDEERLMARETARLLGGGRT